MRLTAFLLLQQGNTGPLGREGITGPTGRTVSLSQYRSFFSPLYSFFFFNLISRVIYQVSPWVSEKQRTKIEVHLHLEGDSLELRDRVCDEEGVSSEVDIKTGVENGN